MGLWGELSNLLKETPRLYVYGNCESCLVEFDGGFKHYSNLKDLDSAARVVRDFNLAGREIMVESGKKTEYEGHTYHGMRHIHLSDFRSWLRRQKVNVK